MTLFDNNNNINHNNNSNNDNNNINNNNNNNNNNNVQKCYKTQVDLVCQQLNGQSSFKYLNQQPHIMCYGTYDITTSMILALVRTICIENIKISLFNETNQD